MSSMRIILFCFIVLLMSADLASAGYLSGNSEPFVDRKGMYALKLSSSLLMVDTQFSSFCLAGKYGIDDNLCLSGKYGVGTIDYSTVTGTQLSSDPQIYAFGLEYVFGGSKQSEYYALITEYETVSWSINRVSNTSNEILIGIDLGRRTTDTLRTRYRMALHNFNAGTQSQEKISSSTRYSFSTELEYNFSVNVKGSFELGVYLGDPVGGLISYFGLGLGFNS